MEKVYGKLREGDLPVLESTLTLFRKYGLKAGLHGTSLWNSKYKDIDLLVFSQSNDVKVFKEALNELLQVDNVELLGQKGDDVSGLDYDIKIDQTILHLSFVILL